MTENASKMRWPVTMAAATAAIIGPFAFAWMRWPDDADASRAPAAIVPAVPRTASAVIRPAATPAASSIGAPGFNDLAADTEIALTDNQELIADSALRKVMDSYLLGNAGDKRLPALFDELNRRLPTVAARDAGQLATSYNAYIGAHDQLLAAQGFGATPDLNRLLGWQQQRAQLRERMLGAKVSDEWFGTEDTYLSQALEELRQQRDGKAPPSASANADEALHAQHMRDVLRDAIVRLRP